MITILAAILVFGLLITVHELGHFLVAKATGMQVDEFAIGFGPLIYQNKTQDTVYSLRLVPLGGFNRIAGMDSADTEVKNGFASKPLWARMLVILAGSGMNFILPFVLFFGIFAFSGIDKPVNTPTVGLLLPGQPAALAGMMPGDKVLAIGNTPIKTWDDLLRTVTENGPKEVDFRVDRAGSQRIYKVTPLYNEEAKRAMVGIAPKMEKHSLSIGQAASTALSYEGRIIVGMVNGLQKMVTGKSNADISGPIGVAQMAGNVASQGLLPLLSFIAFLSINLAIINLLPVPALDGGHFVVLLVEGFRGKPLPLVWQERIQMLGIALIITLTIFTTFKDITR